MIPKKIFFFWGGTTLSWMRYMSLYSFKKLNPDWEVTLCVSTNSSIVDKNWSTKELQDYHSKKLEKNYLTELEKLDIIVLDVNEDIKYLKDVNPVHQSDIYRWKRLSEVGGLYSDTDILFTKPIEKYYRKIQFSDIIICYRNKYHSIGFLGCSENNPFFKKVHEEAISRISNKAYTSQYQSFGSHLLKTQGSDNGIKINYSQCKVYNNPMDIVYPFLWKETDKIFVETIQQLPVDCIGIHWFGGAPDSHQMNRTLTDVNYKDTVNTFTHFVKALE